MNDYRLLKYALIMEIYIKQLNNKSPIKKLINKYLLNWKEESSIIFAQIIKEYLGGCIGLRF